MASVRTALSTEARRRARGRIEVDGDSPLLLLRCTRDVQELRWLAGGRVEVLRDALDVLRREFTAAGDPVVGLAAALVQQALAGEAAAA